MNRYTCWCKWSMPETCANAIAAHQQEHPTEEQRAAREATTRKEAHRLALRRTAEAMRTGKPLDAITRLLAIDAMFNGDRETVFDEIWRKPLLRELDEEAKAETDKPTEDQSR